MHTTNRPTRPTASRGGHPRPSLSDRHATQKPHRQHVNRPMRTDASGAVARCPAASRRSRLATLLATSTPSIGAQPRASARRRSGGRAGRRTSPPRRRPRRSLPEARRRPHPARFGTRGRSARATRRDRRQPMTAVRSRPAETGGRVQRRADRAVRQIVASGQRVDVGVVTNARVGRAKQDRRRQLLRQHRLGSDSPAPAPVSRRAAVTAAQSSSAQA